MTNRPICTKCRLRPKAINYYKDGKPYYRKTCESCLAKSSGHIILHSLWESAGYVKKSHCEKCGFKAPVKEQLLVLHLDKNMKNNNWKNLKTVCANCYIELNVTGVAWRQGSLVPDF